MRARCTESVLVHLTRDEHRMVVALTELRHATPGDVLRELIGLPREDELPPPSPPALRLVTSRLAAGGPSESTG